jgi:hypothetical protein
MWAGEHYIEQHGKASRSRPKRMVLFDRIDISSTSFRGSPKGPEAAQRGIVNRISSVIMLSSLSLS